MDPHARQHITEQLVASEARLFGLLDRLTPAQWHFRESPERWSIAENVEHLILFEAFLQRAIANTLDTPAELEKKTLAPAKQPLVLGLANSRATRFTAREVNRPTGHFSGTEEMLATLKASRAQTIAFVHETRAALHDHFFPHIAFGDLDCFQWLQLLSQHSLRHALQIEQIQADPAYPPS